MPGGVFGGTGYFVKGKDKSPTPASSPTRHSYLNSELLKSEPIVNLSTAQLIGYEVLTQLPSEHDSEVFQQLMLMEGIETSEQRSIAFTLVQRWNKVIYGQPYYQIYIRAMEKQDAQRTTQGKTPPFKKC